MSGADHVLEITNADASEAGLGLCLGGKRFGTEILIEELVVASGVRQSRVASRGFGKEPGLWIG